MLKKQKLLPPIHPDSQQFSDALDDSQPTDGFDSESDLSEDDIYSPSSDEEEEPEEQLQSVNNSNVPNPDIPEVNTFSSDDTFDYGSVFSDHMSIPRRRRIPSRRVKDTANTVPQVEDFEQAVKDLAEKLATDEYGVVNQSSIKSDPVSDTLAATLIQWLKTCPNKKELKEQFQSCLIPGNVQALEPVRINEILYPRLNFKAKDVDRRLKSMNTFLTRSIGPLVSMWDLFIKAEAYAQKLGTDLPFINIGTCQVNLKSLREKLVNAIRLLSSANAITLQKRRVALRPHLDPKYQLLTRPSNPITKLLLGDNIEQKMSEIFKVSMATKRRGGYLVKRSDRFKPRQDHRFDKFKHQRSRFSHFDRSHSAQSSHSSYRGSRGPFRKFKHQPAPNFNARYKNSKVSSRGKKPYHFNGKQNNN